MVIKYQCALIQEAAKSNTGFQYFMNLNKKGGPKDLGCLQNLIS